MWIVVGRHTMSLLCGTEGFEFSLEEGRRKKEKGDSLIHTNTWMHSQSTTDMRRVHPWFWELFSEQLSSPSAGDSPPPPRPVLWEVNLEASFAICGLPHAGKTLSWGDLLSFQSGAKKSERGREHGPTNPSKSFANFSVHPPDSTSSTQST